MLNKSEQALFEFVTLRICLNACQTLSLVFESVFNETRVVYMRQPVKASRGLCANLRESIGNICWTSDDVQKSSRILGWCMFGAFFGNLREALGHLRKSVGLLLNILGIWVIFENIWRSFVLDEQKLTINYMYPCLNHLQFSYFSLHINKVS